MRKIWIIAVLLLAVAALMVGGVACKSSKKKSTSGTPTATAEATMSGDETMASETPVGTPTDVSATLTEFKITLDKSSAPAGAVAFDVKNIGGTDHEFHIVKTELAPTALPTKADGSFDEDAAGTTMVDHIQNLPKGEEKTLTVNLEPGHYVILCNVVQTAASGTPTSHFHEGMYAEFTVTQ